MVKITLSEGQILTKNFDFIGHLSTFRAENTQKNDAYTTSEQLQTNFQNVQKMAFLGPVMVTMTLSYEDEERAEFWSKITILEVIYVDLSNKKYTQKFVS